MERNYGSATIEVRASVARFKRDLDEISRIATRGVARLQRDADRANQRLSRLGVGLRQNMDTAARSVGRVNSELGQTDRLARDLIATIGGVAAARAIVNLADEYTNLSARIRLVLREGEEFAQVQDRIFQAAQRSRAPVADLTTLYVRLRQSMADLGDAEALNISETLARTLTISGASATETAGFLRQISQALASGVLRGDEFNSVMENNSRFARLLADHLGVSVGELRKMAEEGRLTADIIRGAVAGGAAQINSEFERMPLTIGGAMTQIRNALARYVGETDAGLGASRRLAEGLSLLSRNFGSVADAALVAAGAMGSVLLGRGVSRGVSRGMDRFRGVLADASRVRHEARAWVEREDADLSGARTAHLFAGNNQRDVSRRAARARGGLESQLARSNERLAEARRLVLYHRGVIEQHLGRSDADEVQRATLEGRPPRLSTAADTSLGRMQVYQLTRAQEELNAARTRHEQISRRIAIVDGASARAMEGVATAAVGVRRAEERVARARADLARQSSLWARTNAAFTASIGAVRRGLGSLVSFMGGPLGVALTVGIGLWMAFKGAQDRAAQSAARLQDALSIIANATPAFEGAADQIGEVAGETRTMAELTERAAEATDNLAEAQRRAAGAAAAQTDATRALAEIRRRDAIATVQQALAEERLNLRRMQSYTAGERAMDFITGDFIGDRAGRRDPGAQAIAESREYVATLERGLAALQSGLLDVNGAGAGGGGGSGNGPGGRDELATLRMQAELNLARLRNEFERVAVLEDALAVEERTAAYAKAGLSASAARAEATREVRAEREATVAAQQEELRLTMAQWDIERARAQDQHRLAEEREDALEIEQRALDLRSRFRLSEEEAIRRAREYVEAQRAAAEAARQRSEAEAELSRLLEIAEAEGRVIESERLSRQAEIARRAADYRARGYGDKSELAAARDVDLLAAARMRGYAREALSSALLAAATGGSWREALARSLQQAAERGFTRAIDIIYDVLEGAVRNAFSGARAASGGGRGGISSVWNALGGLFPGGGFGGGTIPGKANGGPIKPFTLYKGAEIGTEPIFLTNKPGNVVTNAQMRASLAGAGGGGKMQIFNIDARGADGTSEARIRLAAAEGAAMGEQRALASVSRISKSRSSI